MTHFADLTVCRYFPIDHENKLLAVGWLDRDFDYTRGEVDPDVVANLCDMLVSPWEPAVTMGWHDCPFCRFSDGPRQFTYNGVTVNLGVSNVFVPADGCIYIAPSLVLHYIDAHDYSPPEPFCDAVMECPKMRSIEYLKTLTKNAPRALISQTKAKF